MPDFRSISQRLSTPQAGYAGYGSGYGWASGSPYGRSRSTPMLPGAKKDWEREAGDLDRCSAVAICLGWLQDNFSQARMEVGRWSDPKTFVAAKSHRVLEMLGPEGQPNEDYDADVFWSAAIASWKVDGNLFAIKGRGSAGAGEVRAVWWEPHWNVTPWHAPGDPRLVSWYYVQRPEGMYRVAREDVVHVRDGIDKYNPMLGCSRVKTAVRAIAGHNASETYSASIVDGMGGLGALWSPEGDPIDEDEALQVAAMLRRQTSGENAGRLVALSIGGRVDRVALSPQEMALDSIPDRFEATICAAMGVNPMVAGLAAGASMRSYANQGEADRQSWNNGLIPMQRRFARGLQSELLVDFAARGATAIRFDSSAVPALQANATEEATRASTLVGGGIATVNEGRGIVGLPPIEGHDELEPPQPEPKPGDDPNANQDTEDNSDGS